MAKIQPVKAGDVISEGLLNRIVDQFERFANLKSNSPYIRLWDGPYGKSIALALPQQTWALLSGSSSPYSFTEVRDGPGGTWASMPNGDSGTSNVYEINGKSGLAGKVVPITWTAAGDWRFQWVGYGSCGWRVVTNACNGRSLAGVLVEIFATGDPGTILDSCTSAWGMISAITVTNPGSGYSSAPTVSTSGGTGSGEVLQASMRVNTVVRTSGGSGYTNGSYTNGTFSGGGGSGATFSYSVTGGVINAIITVTNQGSGYTTAPTPVFNAGPGTGAAATSTLRLSTVLILDGGTGHTLPAPSLVFTGGGGSGITAVATVSAYCRFTGVSGEMSATLTPPSGYDLAPVTQNTSLSCTSGVDVITTFTVTPIAFFLCFCNCDNPFPTQLFFEDDYGVHTLIGSTSPNRFSWTVTIAAPVSSFHVAGGIDPACIFEQDTTTLRYDLVLICNGVTPHWEFSVTFGRDCCGPTFPTQGPVYRSSSTATQALITQDWDGSCIFSSLDFTVPTTVSTPCGSLAMLGGGGLITVTR